MEPRRRIRLPKPVWSRRWLIIRLTLLFVAAIDTYIVVLGAADSVRETALWVLNGLAGAVILGYLGFATHDDNNWMKAITGAFGRQRHAERDYWLPGEAEDYYGPPGYPSGGPGGVVGDEHSPRQGNATPPGE